MKNFFKCLLPVLLLCCAYVCNANYAFVNYAKNASNSNTITVSLTTGNLGVLVSSTSSGAGTPTVTQVQDNTGANWTAAISTYQPAGYPGGWFSVFYKENLPAGVTSVTVTYNGGTPGTCGLTVVQYSGIATSSSFISAASQGQVSPGTGTDAISSGATTISAVPALVLGIVQNAGNSDTVAGTGFTGRTAPDNDWFVEDKRATSTGSQTATATAATHGGGDTYFTVVAGFKEAVAGGVDGSMFQLF